MEAKLIKTKQELIVNYHLKNENGHTIATTLFPVPTEVEYLANSRGITLQKLSYDNCQAIERGYDLDKLANELLYSKYPFNPPNDSGYWLGMYKEGFQKCLELMGDKKFSESDVKAGIRRGYVERQKDEGVDVYFESYEEFIQSLQQTEWDVEIEMGKVESYKDKMSNVRTEKTFPTLDADGCLILKLKS